MAIVSSLSQTKDTMNDGQSSATRHGGRTPPAIAQQLESARSGAFVVPAPDMAVLCAAGADRLKWLNGLVTCDVAKLVAGDAIYGLAVAQKGKILVDLAVVAGDDRLWIVLPRAKADPLREWLDRHLVMEDVELSSDASSVLYAHGPRSLEALEAARRAGARGGPLNRTGLGGAIVLAPEEKQLAVRDAMLAAGATLGTDEGWDVLRLERHVPRFGVDFDDTLYPQEASLEHVAVSFDKGCYLGQEVVYMLQNRGHVKRKLVPLRLDASAAPARKTPVTTLDRAPIGEVTSAVVSPTLGAPIAFAMVKVAHAAPGTAVRVGDAGAHVMTEPV
jgi:hypothetical protein